MIFRMLRFFADSSRKSFPLTIESHFQMLKTSSYSPGTLPSIIKAFYHLYTDSKTYHTTINWNSHPIIKSSINNMIPHLPNIENKYINSLIVSLGFMGIGPHPIWKQLEPLFLGGSYKEVEDFYVPYVITSFSVCKCQNPVLWQILNQKLIDNYLKTQTVSSTTAVLTYKSLMLARQGSPAVLNQLKTVIINNMHEIRYSSISGLLNAMSYNKQLDQDLAKPLIAKVMQDIDLIDASELSKILGNLSLLVYDRKVCELIESKLMKKVNDLSFKDLVACFSLYCQKRSLLLEFPKNLFAHYMNKRLVLKSKVENKDVIAVYDVKMLGSAIDMDIVMPDKFFLEIFEEIKKSKMNIGDSKTLQANYASVEKYKSFHKFKS